MLCLLYENGRVMVLENEFPEKLIFKVIQEKHMLYLDDNEKTLSFEKDYETLTKTYKVMHELRALEKCANDAYVSKITKEYETLYKGKTIYSWAKEKQRELKKNN